MPVASRSAPDNHEQSRQACEASGVRIPLFQELPNSRPALRRQTGLDIARNDHTTLKSEVPFKLNEVVELVGRLTCVQCGQSHNYHRCPNCARTMHVSERILNLPKWKCLGCGYQGKQSKFPLAAAVPKDLTALRAYYMQNGADPDQAITFQGRAIVVGAILSTEGLSGLTSGGSTLEFGDDVIFAMIGTWENTIRVPFTSVRILNFSGRGAVTTTMTKGGGFFGGGIGGLSSMGEGMLMAQALNALTTKTVSTTTIETIVTLQWDSGGVVLLNQQFVPSELNDQFRHVFERLAVVDRTASDTQSTLQADVTTSALDVGAFELTGQLEKLAELHFSGVLTDEEFAMAKTKLLAT